MKAPADFIPMYGIIPSITIKDGFLFARHGGQTRPAVSRRHPDQGKTIRIARALLVTAGSEVKDALGREQYLTPANLIRRLTLLDWVVF